MKRSIRRQSIIRLFASVLLLISLNVIANFLFRRIDLTEEKRYSISPTTIEQLKKLNDVIYIKVYLEGDLPPGFKRLRNSIKELLDEFRVYAKDNIEYEFIDPSASADKKERNELYGQLAKKGIEPTTLEERKKGEASEKIIFPGAVITFHGREYPVMLLKNKIGSSSEEMLNHSIESLEYDFMNVFRATNIAIKPKVGFLQGQKELNTKAITDAARALSDFYAVDTVDINGRLNALKSYKLIIIARPDTAFNERDKFIIDQFIMHGGRVLWLVEEMQMSSDSLLTRETNIAVAQNLNLQDQLFKYGVRVNDDLIMDLQCAPISVVTGRVANEPKLDLKPWYFYPLINPTSTHPIVFNLNDIKCEFASSLDTVAAEGVNKTILLTTSKYSKRFQSPVRVSLNMLREEPDPALFNQRYLPVAALLEGTFHSVFAKRIPPQIAADSSIGFKEVSVPNKMIVISDGDIIASYVSKRGTIYNLGYDRFTHQIYGNKNFILNCVDYLCDQENIVSLRSKEFKIRQLDPAKAERPVYGWLALLLPIVSVFIYGMVHFYIRRRKYAS